MPPQSQVAPDLRSEMEPLVLKPTRKPKDPLTDRIGIKPPDPIDYLAIARNLRRMCNGAFGSMSTNRYNARVLGTSAAERISAS